MSLEPSVATCTLTNAIGTTPAVKFADFASGGFIVPTDVTAVVIHASADGVTYGSLCAFDGTAVGSLGVTAGTFFVFPQSVSGANFLKFVLTGVASAAVTISRKP